MSAAVRVLGLLLSLAALFFTPRALAFSCEAPPQLKSSTERADVVFVGVVAAETPMSFGLGLYHLRVERVFKGAVPATVDVTAGSMTGASFTVGDRYLVFAEMREQAPPRPPGLFAHLCGGTQTAERAADWITALGAGEPPPPAPAPPSERSAPVPPAVTSHTTTTPATSGGCAGCTSAGSYPITPSASVTALALLILARRRTSRG